MMKKITLLFILLTVSFGYSQNAPIDFESGGNGASWTWGVFENATNPAVEIIANPVSGGINTSATVMKFTALDAGQNWAGCESQHGSDIGTWSTTASNSYVTMKVYQVGFASQVALKFANSVGGAIGETFATVSAADTWVEVSFDMSAWIGHPDAPTDQIVMFPDRSDRTADHIIYIDDVTFGPAPAPTCTDGMKNGDETGVDCGGPDCDPCPPIPPLFIDFETEPITADFTNFAGGTATVIPNPQGSGNVGQMVRTADQVYAGSWIPLATSPDFTTFTKIKMKVWTEAPIGTNISIKTEGGTGSGDKTAFTTATSAWETLEYDFTGAADNTQLTFLFDLGNLGDGSATSTFLFDDIEQFDPTAGLNDFDSASFNVYPNPSNDVWNVKTNNAVINSVQVFDILGKQVLSLSPNASEAKIDGSTLTRGLYFATITTEFGTSSKKLIKE